MRAETITQGLRPPREAPAAQAAPIGSSRRIEWTVPLLAGAGCVGFSASFYVPLGGWLLGWLCLVPFLRLADDPSRRRFVRGFLLTLALFGPCLAPWLIHAGRIYALNPEALAVGIPLTWISTGAFVAGWLVVARFILHRRRDGVAAPALLLAASWVAVELARFHAYPWIPAGGPLFMLGYTQTDVPLLIQAADLAGVHGLSFAVALGNAALYLALWRRRHAWKALVIGVLAPLMLCGYGAVRLASPARGERIRVAAVRVDLPAKVRWHEESYLPYLRKYVELSRRAADAGAELIAWPEAAVPLFLKYEAGLREELARGMEDRGTWMIVGAPDIEGESEDPTRSNSAFLMGPDGEIRDRYTKREPVPFAERLPSYGTLGRFYTKGESASIAAGGDQPPLTLPAARAGVLICWESAFARLARGSVRGGADLLVNLTNETTLVMDPVRRLMLHHAALRAVETRRWMLRSVMAFSPAAISPEGRIFLAQESGSPSLLIQDVERLEGGTIYAEHGDVFAAACAVAALAGLAVVAAVPGRRERGLLPAPNADGELG